MHLGVDKKIKKQELYFSVVAILWKNPSCILFRFPLFAAKPYANTQKQSKTMLWVNEKMSKNGIVYFLTILFSTFLVGCQNAFHTHQQAKRLGAEKCNAEDCKNQKSEINYKLRSVVASKLVSY